MVSSREVAVMSLAKLRERSHKLMYKRIGIRKAEHIHIHRLSNFFRKLEASV